MRIQNAFDSIVRDRSGSAARYFQCWCFCWLATRILNIKIMFSTSRYVVIKRKNVKRHCHRRWEIMNDRPFKTKEVHFQARSKLLGIITFWWLLKITFEQSSWNVWAFCQKQKQQIDKSFKQIHYRLPIFREFERRFYDRTLF